ncbi:MAG: hypothetical protein FJ297_06720 [Planctomycetes bacterium]|nr:hypothetical protein [Planctomycetota bacterium]
MKMDSMGSSTAKTDSEVLRGANAAEPGRADDRPLTATQTGAPPMLAAGPHEAIPSDDVPESDQKTVISKRPPPSDWGFSPATAQDLGRLLIGEQLGHFVLDEFVGGGGMGAVFRATDTELGRHVAVKILSGAANDEDTLRRFKNEAQSAARLDHKNIARVYYVGADKGWHYIVFEFIQGTNLRDLVRQQGPLPVHEAIQFTLQVAEALEHAASRSVVHRDIKPSNVLVQHDGTVKLVDMGLARLHQVDATHDLTASGVTLGTFDYISPEQAREPRDADARSDMYSLGCTLFYMLTGHPPFPQGTVLQKLLSHSSEPPPDPRDARPDLGDDVADVVHRLLEKDPSDRYQTPTELIIHLLRIAENRGLSFPFAVPHPAPDSPSPRIARLARHVPWLIPTAALLAIAGLVDRWSGPRTVPVNRPVLTPAASTERPLGPRGPSSTTGAAGGDGESGTDADVARPTTPPPDPEASVDSKAGSSKAGRPKGEDGAEAVPRAQGMGGAATKPEPRSNSALPRGSEETTTSPSSRPGHSGLLFDPEMVDGVPAKTEAPNAEGQPAERRPARGDGTDGVETSGRVPVDAAPGSDPSSPASDPSKENGVDASATDANAPRVDSAHSVAALEGAERTANATAVTEPRHDGAADSGREGNSTRMLPPALDTSIAGAPPIGPLIGAPRSAVARIVVTSKPDVPADAAHAPSLTAALARLDSLPEIRAIELWYDGPMVEAPLVVGAPHAIEIRAGAGYRPGIVFRAPEASAAGSRRMIELAGGKSVWKGIHFVMDLPETPSRDWALFGLRNVETAEFQDCTFTIRNTDRRGVARQDSVTFLEIVTRRRNRRIDMDMEMDMVAGAAPRQPAPTLPPFVHLERCAARGEASLLVMNESIPCHVVWEQGLLITSRSVFEIRGATDLPTWDSEWRVRLSRVTAAADQGLLVAELDPNAPLLLDADLELIDSVIVLPQRVPLVEYRGVSDPVRAERSLHYRGERNFYPVSEPDSELDPSVSRRIRWRVATHAGASREFVFDDARHAWYSETEARQSVIWREPPTETGRRRPHHERPAALFEMDAGVRNPARSAGFDPRLVPSFPDWSAANAAPRILPAPAPDVGDPSAGTKPARP